MCSNRLINLREMAAHKWVSCSNGIRLHMLMMLVCSQVLISALVLKCINVMKHLQLVLTVLNTDQTCPEQYQCIFDCN